MLFVIVALYFASLESKYDVSNSRLIKADPIVVFNDLNDFRNWQEWGPWYEQDSTIQAHYEDQTIGEGGAYSWTSDIDGGGRMRTILVDKSKRIDQELIFETPFGDMKSEVYWLLDKTDSGTALTWGIKGELPFFSRFMTAGMEDQLGPMEVRGLELFDQNLQRKLKIFSIDSVGVVDYSGGFYLYLSTSSKIQFMNSKVKDLGSDIGEFIAKNNIRSTGSIFVIYHKFDKENGTALYSVCYPIAEKIISQDSEILTGYMERGTYHKTILKGDYSNADLAWEKAEFDVDNLSNYSINDEGETFEIFINNPDNTPNPANLISEIYIPVKVK